MSGFLGSGTLYFNRVVSGVSQGWLALGNATKFAIKENSEKKERKLKKRGQYGQVGDSVFVKQPAELSINLDDIDAQNLALAFLGDVSAVSVTAGSVTDEAVTADLGFYVPLANREVSNVVVTNSAATVTYVAGTDYEVVAGAGMLKALSGGAITDAESLLVDYDYAAISGNKVLGGTNPTVKLALKLDGENFANSAPVLVDVWEAVLSPTSEVDFLADDFAAIELAGTLNTPTSKTSPYEVTL
ncbi:MAG: hypothetical protein ABFS30_10235 [Pseudomonadota bacterium]